MNDWKELTKIGLLAVLAVTLVYGTFFKSSKSRERKRPQIGRSATAAPNPIQQQPTSDPNEFNAENAKFPANDQSANKSQFANTAVVFETEEHDFGTVKQHSENDFIFTFKNTGEEPLLIENAQGSCGCTVPDFPKEPIMPGEEGVIKVKYSPGTQIGSQTKTVAITSNTEPRVRNLFIKANVVDAPDPVL
jgi:hypothetical protein